MQKAGGKIHLATVRRLYKGKLYVSHLLRRSYRAGGRVKSQTVGSISALPAELVELVRRGLGGEQFLAASELEIERSLPHGHVQAVLSMMRKLGLAALLDRAASRSRDLTLAMIAARVLEPASKLATTRLWQESPLSWAWREPTRTSSTAPWTGCWRARTGSRIGWLAATCRKVGWCSTT